MPSVSIQRLSRTITTFLLDFPDLRQQLPVAIDRYNKEVFITPWFYPGGPLKCAQDAVFQGEPLFALDVGYLISARFVLASKNLGNRRRVVDMLVKAANMALEREHEAFETDDPNGYSLYGPDAGRNLALPH